MGIKGKAAGPRCIISKVLRTCAANCDPESHSQPESQADEDPSVVENILSGFCTEEADTVNIS